MNLTQAGNRVMDGESSGLVKAFDMCNDMMHTCHNAVLSVRELVQKQNDASVDYDNSRRATPENPISGRLHAGRDCVIHKSFPHWRPPYVRAIVRFPGDLDSRAGAEFGGLHCMGMDWYWGVKPDIEAAVNGLGSAYTVKHPPSCLTSAVKAKLGDDKFQAVLGVFDAQYRRAMMLDITADMCANAKAKAILVHAAPTVDDLVRAGLQLPLPWPYHTGEHYGSRYTGAGPLLDAIGALALHPNITDFYGSTFIIESPPGAKISSYMGTIDGWFTSFGASNLGFGQLPCYVELRCAMYCNMPVNGNSSDSEDSGSVDL